MRRAWWTVLLLAASVRLEAQQPAPPAIRYDRHIPVAGTPPPGATLTNPLAGDSTAASEGARLFEGFNCGGCHGGTTGAVGPSLADGRWRYGGADGEIFHSIFYGRPRGMPAFGGAVPAASIWRIVAWLKSIEPAPDSLATTHW